MDEQGWKLKREVSIGELLMVVSIGIGAVTAYVNMDRRMTKAEETHAAFQLVTQKEFETLHTINRLQDERLSRVTGDLKGSLEMLNTKMDRLIDRQMSHGRD